MERYSYGVFGEPSETSSIGNPYLFTGRRYDNETGNYYYRARYYSPTIGRFMQVDPMGYSAGLNYTYCWNNPVNYIDPYGLLRWVLRARLLQKEKMDCITDALKKKEKEDEEKKGSK